jgi:hypothetical protein
LTLYHYACNGVGCVLMSTPPLGPSTSCSRAAANNYSNAKN